MARDSTADLLRIWRTAYEQPVPQGWDLSEFAGRIEESVPPWSYERLAREALTGAGSVLDLGTGGGERYADQHHHGASDDHKLADRRCSGGDDAG